MKNLEGDFILKLLEITEPLESPESFIKWGGYAAISTVLRDNVYINFSLRRTRIYPNLYILIIADSGELRKSTPLKIAFSLAENVNNNKLIKGRASIQGIMKELAKTEIIEGYKFENASALIYSEEFAASLVADPSAIRILTDLYDYHKEHKIYLKSEETVVLKEVVVNLLAASNQSNLATLISQADMKGGFVGRALIIIGEKPRTRNLGLEDDPQSEAWKELDKELKAISKHKGPISFSTECSRLFDDWYNLADITDPTGTGFGPRIHTHAIKISIIRTASAGNLGQKSISCDAIIESIKDVSSIKHNYHKIMTGAIAVGNNSVTTTNHIMAIFVKELKKEHEHGDLLGQLLAITDSATFDSAIQTLKMSHMIEANPRLGSTYYKPTKKMRDIYGGVWKSTPPVVDINAGR